MTCIAGIAEGGKVWIGGDSAGVSNNWTLMVRADEKVFTTGPFVMGFTSSFRMGQLLRYSLTVPEQTSDQTDHAFMCTTFIDAVRGCLKTGGYARKEHDAESGGCFLVGYRGNLYLIGSDYQVGRPSPGYDAVGCGGDVALGALFASSGPPSKRVKTALRAAASHNAGVRGPFKVVSA